MFDLEKKLQPLSLTKVQSAHVPQGDHSPLAQVNWQDQDENPEFDYLVENAKLLFRHQDQNLGIQLLGRVLHEDSYYPKALEAMQFFFDQKGDYAQCLKIQEQKLKVKYDFEEVASLGHIHYKCHQDQKAKEKYFEALSLVVETSSALFDVYKNLGNIFVRERDFEQAEDFFHRAFAMNSNSDILYVNYGTLEIQKGDWLKAKSHFQKALEIQPRNDKAWVGLAMIHASFQEMPLAWANLETALEIFPGNKTAVLLFASWSVKEQKVSQATEAHIQYLDSQDFDLDVSTSLVHLFCLENRFDLALMELERALLFQPLSEELDLLYFQIRRASGSQELR